MNKKDMLQLKDSLTMPSEMADTLLQTVTASDQHRARRHHNRPASSVRYRRLGAAAAALFCLFAVGSTSLAYNIYQEKQLAVFMEPDLSQAEIDYIGQKIADICGIPSFEYVTRQFVTGTGEYATCRYVSGDEAWEEFKAAYLTDENGAEIPELTETFKENPLADSFNYRVSVRLSADTQAIREQIEGLAGVRKVTTVREAKAR